MSVKFNLRRIIGYAILICLSIAAIWNILKYIDENNKENQMLLVSVLFIAFASFISSLVLIFSKKH